MDVVSPEIRSRIMASVRAKDTTPEMAVRRLAHSLGYRFRLHVKSLPGAPDIVFAARRKLIFVHGCFWHQHNCRRWSDATRRSPYWRKKLGSNRARDRRSLRALRDTGWDVLIIWECETSDVQELARRLTTFLDTTSSTQE
jgi:DNA mismatch endonuclease (patch repair protein)